MLPSALKPLAGTLNAQVGAIALAVASFAILAMSHVTVPLSPLRLFVLALALIAVWAFCDEMGVGKPLNRAGFVFFAIAVGARLQAIVGVPAEVLPRYHLLYSAFMLAAILLWSVAFLHRKRIVKIVGAFGLASAFTALSGIVMGHIALSAGVVVGVSAVLSAAAGAADNMLVCLVDRVFGLWGYVTAWLLWRGHVASPAAKEVLAP
jgi:hypothetical protein